VKPSWLISGFGAIKKAQAVLWMIFVFGAVSQVIGEPNLKSRS
jgi:hypothetical protein